MDIQASSRGEAVSHGPQRPHRLPHESPTAPFFSLEAHAMGNSPSDGRGKDGGSGGKRGISVESLSRLTTIVLSRISALTPRGAPGWQALGRRDPHVAFLLTKCVYTRYLHTTVCYGNVSKGNCLMWKGKRLVEQKRITSPSLEPRTFPPKGGKLFHIFKVFSWIHHIS